MRNNIEDENSDIRPWQHISEVIPEEFAEEKPSLWSKDTVLTLLSDRRVQAAAIGFPYGGTLMFVVSSYGVTSMLALMAATAYGMLAYRFLFADRDDE